MKSKGFLNRLQRWWEAAGHFGRLGRTATQRSFLLRERRKLYEKLGERAAKWLREDKEAPPELIRLMGQIDKIQALLSRMDYGGENGVDFHSRPPKRKRLSRRE